MTRADLTEEIARALQMPRKEAEIVVITIFDSIVRSVRTGEKTEIRGFGSFRIRNRQPRIDRNPKTGAPVKVPARAVPYFKPSKKLKGLVINTASVPMALDS